MREFIVRPRAGATGRDALWVVEDRRDVHGNYLSEWAALLDAIDAAQAAGKAGEAAVVLVEAADGTVAPRWRYGDVYPFETAATRHLAVA